MARSTVLDQFTKLRLYPLKTTYEICDDIQFISSL